MIGQGRPTISAVVAALVWLAGATWLAAQENAAPADSLRIIAHRDPLIFAPGEQFTFDLEPSLAGVEPSTAIDIAASLTRAGGSNTLWNTQQRVQVPLDGPAIATLHVPLPREEGVYELHLDVTRPPGFRERWFPGGSGAPLVERSFQVVVLDRLPTQPVPDAKWRRIVEVDPANPAWTTKIPDWTQIRRIPGMSRRPIGSVRATPVTLSLGTFIELPVTPVDGAAHWQAYPLAIDGAGGPHLLEIEYPNDQEQHLGISIVEPNEQGALVTIGRDSGVYVEGLGASERVERQKHRIVFWPRTNSPLVLVTNQHPTATARFGHLRVYKRTASTLATDPWPAATQSGRMVAAYLSHPIAEHTHAGQLAANDWLAFYDCATQLSEYLNYGGFNAVAIHVLGEESPFIPRQAIESTLRPEIGPIAEAADTPAADGLELALRVFDRCGLALIPTIEFAAPLPGLEALRQQLDPHSAGIELVGPGGLTWAETHSAEQARAPHYNLLDPRVQQAALDVVQQIVARYGRHPSFQMLAVKLSADGYGVLPGIEWGIDDTTVGRFEQETGVRLGAVGADRFAARQSLLTGKYADLWRGWRAEQVTRFYRQLAQVAAESNSQRRLLLTTERLFDNAEIASRLRPNVTEKPQLQFTMLDMGVDWSALRTSPGIVALPTRYVESMVPLVDRAIDLSINDAFASLERLSPATLFYHRPHQRIVSSPETLLTYGATVPAWSQPAPHGGAGRKPYIDALVHDDPTILIDGGAVAPLGQEDSVRHLRSVIRALPPGTATAAARASNVTVHTYDDRGQTVCLVMNECPWHADVTLDVVSQTPITVLPLVADRDGVTPAAVEQFAAGHQLWALQLAPYDVHAVRFAGGTAKVERIDARISDAGRQELAAKVNELKERDLIATPRYKPLKNPGLEPMGAGLLPSGWQFEGNAAEANASLDAKAPQEAQTCLYLANRGNNMAAITSEEFPVPHTGQLGMWAFVRGANIGPSTTVRLVFEGVGPASGYRRVAVLGGNKVGAEPIAADWGSGYAFKQDDLPMDSRARMRVKFELSGPGEIWIDNVQLYDLLFPLSFYSPGGRERLQLVKRRTEAESELEHGELAECVRTLEGYWPRFINAYTPRVEQQFANQLPDVIDPPEPKAEEPPAAEESPSVSKRSWYNFWSR